MKIHSTPPIMREMHITVTLKIVSHLSDGRKFLSVQKFVLVRPNRSRHSFSFLASCVLFVLSWFGAVFMYHLLKKIFLICYKKTYQYTIYMKCLNNKCYRLFIGTVKNIKCFMGGENSRNRL